MITEKIEGFIQAVYDDLNLMVVDSELVNKDTLPPQYYYYKVINIDLEDRQQGSQQKAIREGKVSEELYLDSKLTVSLTSCGPDLATARSNAVKLWSWLKFEGRLKLKANKLDLVVVTIGDIQDRTTSLYDHYDFKYGFDVELRTLIKLTREVEEVKTYEIKGEIEK